MYVSRYLPINIINFQECEKYETSRSFENIKPIGSNLLHIIVASSNKGTLIYFKYISTFYLKIAIFSYNYFR